MGRPEALPADVQDSVSVDDRDAAVNPARSKH